MEDIVEVPELSGCMADGETVESAVANAEIIIGKWIETAKKVGRKFHTKRKVNVRLIL